MARSKKTWTPKTDEERKAEVDALMVEMQEGVSKLTTEGGWAKWLNFQSKLYTYSFCNTILIALQAPNAKAVASFSRGKARGRPVRKGETSHIRIFAPVKKSIWITEEDPQTGEEKKRRIERLVGWKVAKVFEDNQTDGADIPVRPMVERLKGDDRGIIEVLKAYAVSLGCSVRFGHADGANGYYMPSARQIVIEETMEPAAQAKTLAHEIGHHMLHGDVTDRAMLSRNDKELEAESFAYIVCKNLGLESASYSFAYVACWKGKEADESFRESGKRITDAAKKAIGEIESQNDVDEAPMSEAA